MKTNGKRPMPLFLQGVVSEAGYARGLLREAQAHVVRGRRRGMSATGAQYRDAIHAAVVASGGFDGCTGEPLDWHLVSTDANDDSRPGRHSYKAGFALLPSVDHVDASAAAAAFKVRAWRMNDAKSGLSARSFIALRERVLMHAGYRVHAPNDAKGLDASRA